MAIKVRSGYAPKVRRELIPGIYLNPNIPEGAFGGAIGEGLSRLGAALAAKRGQENNFQAKKLFIDEATRAQMDFVERQRTAPLGAEGFTVSTLAQYEKDHLALLDRMRQGGFTQEQIEDTDLQLSTLRQSIVAKSLEFESNSISAKASKDFGEVGDNLANIVLAAPDDVDESLRLLRETVDKLPVPEIEKEKLYESYEKLIRLSAAHGRIGQDPVAVRDALKPGQGQVSIENEDEFILAMKRGTFGVESAHTDQPYRAKGPVVKGHQALGKYQVMDYNVRGWTKQALGEALTPSEFLDSPAAQEAVFEDQMRRLYRKYGNVEDAASVWFTGVPYAQAVAEGRHDVNLTVQQYIERVKGGTGGVTATGDPVLDLLDADERLAIYNAANTAANQKDASIKAKLDLDESNASTAYLSGIQYTGELPTQDRYRGVYGDLVGGQKWAAFENTQRVGGFIQEMKTLPVEAIMTRLNEMKAQIGVDPNTIAVDTAALSSAQEAATRLVQARTEDSVGYAMQHFPAVQAAFETAIKGEGVTRQAAYLELSRAYDQLGLLPSERKAFPAAMLTKLRDEYAAMTPEAKIASLVNMQQELGDLFYAGLEQMREAGMRHEAYLADLVTTSPEHKVVAANALRGLTLVKENESLRPNPEAVHPRFRATMGDAQRFIPPDVANSLRELTEGLYAFEGGNPARTGEGLNTELFDKSLRQLLGGSGEANTGVAQLSVAGGWWSEFPTLKTILPTNTTKEEFEKWIDTVDKADYERLGGVPRYADGREVSPEEINEEGIFVRVDTDRYMIIMSSDGEPLKDESGEQYFIRLTEQEIKENAADTVLPETVVGPDGEVISPSERVDVEVDPETGLPVLDETPAARSASELVGAGKAVGRGIIPSMDDILAIIGPGEAKGQEISDSKVIPTGSDKWVKAVPAEVAKALKDDAKAKGVPYDKAVLVGAFQALKVLDKKAIQVGDNSAAIDLVDKYVSGFREHLTSRGHSGPEIEKIVEKYEDWLRSAITAAPSKNLQKALDSYRETMRQKGYSGTTLDKMVKDYEVLLRKGLNK